MNIVVAFLSSLLGFSPTLGIVPEADCRTPYFPTLMYHHIWEYEHISEMSVRNMSVSPAQFLDQIQALKQAGYRTITSRDIRDGTVPCRSVMITLDDGYYDNFTHAYPLMRQHGFFGVIALIPAHIDESGYVFGHDVRDMLRDGWEIASHSWHHPNLTKTAQLSYQVSQSRKDLAHWFQSPIAMFVYPGGRHDDRVVSEVKNAGYTYAFGTQSGISDLTGDHLRLNRIDVLPGTSGAALIQQIDALISSHLGVGATDAASSQDTVR